MDYFEERAERLEKLYLEESEIAYKYKEVLRNIMEQAIEECNSITVEVQDESYNLDFDTWDTNGDGLVWDDYREVSFQISDLSDPDRFQLSEIRHRWDRFNITLKRI